MPKTGKERDVPQLDFCILGASNSGKSALHAYLRTHPLVFMPEIEPNFYADDIAEYGLHRRPKSRRAYRAIFAGASDGQFLGEMSGRYLFSEAAVPNLLKDSPEVRFIVLLRNPVDMAQSIHSHLLRILDEDERSFQTAWELQDTRAAGKQIPPWCKDPKVLLYRERCSFASHIERFFQLVPRKRILVHVFEEFFVDLKASYERSLAFLGLPPDGRTHFERVQEHAVPRNLLLNRLLRDPPFPFNRLYGPLKRAVNAFGFRPGLAIIRANVGKEKFAPMELSFRRRLEAEFRPEVARLEAILGRDLDIWKSN